MFGRPASVLPRPFGRSSSFQPLSTCPALSWRAEDLSSPSPLGTQSVDGPNCTRAVDAGPGFQHLTRCVLQPEAVRYVHTPRGLPHAPPGPHNPAQPRSAFLLQGAPALCCTYHHHRWRHLDCPVTRKWNYTTEDAKHVVSEAPPCPYRSPSLRPTAVCAATRLPGPQGYGLAAHPQYTVTPPRWVWGTHWPVRGPAPFWGEVGPVRGPRTATGRRQTARGRVCHR